MAKKQPQSATKSLVPASVVRIAALATGPGRTLTSCAVVLTVFVVLVTAVWAHVRPAVLRSSQYRITVEQFDLAPAPSWVPAARANTIVSEALRLATPTDHALSSLDEDLTERLTTAFMFNPWVVMAKVAKRAPARVVVDLGYRKPVCVVAVGDDLQPVDATGVLLPTEDFSALEKQAFPCLIGIETRPLGPAGQHWGDSRVVEGAAIAAAFTPPQWTELKLYRIQPSAGNNYELITRANSRILWGLPPSIVVAGEPGSDDKVGRLLRYAHEHAGLDGPNGRQSFDVRTLPMAAK